MSEPILQVCAAERRFGDLTVFRDVGFSVVTGRCCAIIGANGAGKSTLLRCVLGRDRLDAGRITVDGREVDEADPCFRSTVAAVSGEDATFAHLTVHEHLQLVAIAHGTAEPHRVASRALADVSLSDAADQLPVTLSSGQRRRLALASAFVRPRRLLVLDEPEQHLDRAGRAWLARALVAEKEADTAILLVSHDPDLVAAVADDVVDGDLWR